MRGSQASWPGATSRGVYERARLMASQMKSAIQLASQPARQPANKLAELVADMKGALNQNVIVRNRRYVLLVASIEARRRT